MCSALRKKKTKKPLPAAVDGLGPKDVKRLVTAIRRVWAWNYARKMCLERAVGKDGFSICEKCKKKVPKVYPDHIEPVGTFDPETFIKRMFIPSNQLQAICKKCHNEKSKIERLLKIYDLG